MAKRLTNPKSHPLWLQFRDWADENSVNIDHEEDWIDFWKCFLQGAQAQSSLSNDIRTRNAISGSN